MRNLHKAIILYQISPGSCFKTLYLFLS